MRERRPRRNRNNNGNDADAALKEQLKAERRAQVMQNAADQDAVQTSSGEEANGDTMDAANVSSVPFVARPPPTPRNNNERPRHTRPANKGPASRAAGHAQVGAVAAHGRAFGAPRRPTNTTNILTSSLVSDQESDVPLSEDDGMPRSAKEAIAMNHAMTRPPSVQVIGEEPIEQEHPPPPAARNDNQNDEETMLEAELAVDHMDEIQAARDENEALRRRVEALESGNQGGAVQQGQNDAAIVVAVAADSPSTIAKENDERDDQHDEDDDGRVAKRRMVMFGSLIIIVIAIALAVFFGTRNDPVEVVLADPTTSPVSIPITSSSPTEALLFEKPTEEECNQVRNGNQVEGQEKMPVQNFDIMVDVNVDASVAVADQAHWDELESRIQAAMVPILVGCTSINSSRRRRYLASSRYVVANAVTRVLPLVGQSCVLEQRENGDGACVPVRVNLDAYLKGSEFDVNILIQQLLLEYVKGDVPLVELLELSPGTPFLSIVITSVNFNNPTEAPSTGPTRLPSVAPTIASSLTPSARPTLRPSSNPTGAPS